MTSGPIEYSHLATFIIIGITVVAGVLAIRLTRLAGLENFWKYGWLIVAGISVVAGVTITAFIYCWLG